MNKIQKWICLSIAGTFLLNYLFFFVVGESIPAIKAGSLICDAHLGLEGNLYLPCSISDFLYAPIEFMILFLAFTFGMSVVVPFVLILTTGLLLEKRKII